MDKKERMRALEDVKKQIAEVEWLVNKFKELNLNDDYVDDVNRQLEYLKDRAELLEQRETLLDC